jgi:hypothetical protein
LRIGGVTTNGGTDRQIPYKRYGDVDELLFEKRTGLGSHETAK